MKIELYINKKTQVKLQYKYIKNRVKIYINNFKLNIYWKSWSLITYIRSKIIGFIPQVPKNPQDNITVTNFQILIFLK